MRLLTVLLLACAAPALAGAPHVRVISSDPIAANPPRYRITFEITRVTDDNYFGFLFSIPLSNPTDHLYNCGAPSGWACAPTIGEPDRGAYWSRNLDPWIGPRVFTIESDVRAPCVDMLFDNPILAGQPVLESDSLSGCLDPDLPTAIHPITWGRLRTTYR
jgi:hypothetical protein